MKETFYLDFIQTCFCFISHMVQMKEELLVALGKIGRLNFISHMVQMKECVKQLFFTPIAILYIPHGSDESFIKK